MDHHPYTDSESCLLQSSNGLAHQAALILDDPRSTQLPHLSFLPGLMLKRIGHFINWTEMKMQIWLAVPLILVDLFYFCVLVISVMFVGHLGELQLASAALATSIANVTGSSLVIGMACALETLCGQAYGAKQYRKVGLYLQRAFVILNATAIVLSILWANIEKILLALGQDSQICSGAGDYARWLIPTLFAFATSQPFLKFLQAQSLVIPLMWIGFATVCCHLLICWLLIYKAGLGLEGGAIASSISYWINTLLLAAYVQFSPACSHTRAPLSREALQDLTDFCKLAVPSAAMLCLEWWAYEMLVILSGLLPDPELETSALSICVTTSSIFYMIPYGISTAASTRVSNELGAARPQAALAAVKVGMSLAVLSGVTLSTVLFLIRKLWAHAFSNDEDVINYVSSLIPLLALFTILDNLQGVLSGILRGAGWQKAGAFTNLAAYYGLGLPVGVLLVFVAGLSGKGLIIGVMCGSFTQLVCFSFMTWMANWDAEVKHATTRINSSQFDLSTKPLLT